MQHQQPPNVFESDEHFVDTSKDGSIPSPQTVVLPLELVQAILDYLGTCPAGQVYHLMRALDDQAQTEVPR